MHSSTSMDSFTPGSSLESCLRFEVAGEQVGWISPKVASILGRFPVVFRPYGSTITFSSGLDTFESRSVAVDEVLLELRREATFTCLIGWRDEVRQLCYMLDNCPSSSLLLEQLCVSSFQCQNNEQYVILVFINGDYLLPAHDFQATLTNHIKQLIPSISIKLKTQINLLRVIFKTLVI